MVDRNLERLVEERKREAANKNLDEKAARVLKELGKWVPCTYDAARFLEGDLNVEFFTEFGDITILIKYQNALVFQYKTNKNKKIDPISGENVLRYIPGESTWENKLDGAYERALKKQTRKKNKENKEKEFYLRQAFAL